MPKIPHTANCHRGGEFIPEHGLDDEKKDGHAGGS